MSKKYKIPLVELELADNLFIQIKDVSFIPGRPAYISGLPEDCYEAESAECDWLKENAKLVIRTKEIDMTYEELCNRLRDKENNPMKYKTIEHEFTVDDSFFYEYYDEIIEAIENMEEGI